MLCLYQVTEYMKFCLPDTVENGWTSSTIPNALSRVLVNIASHVKQTPGNSHKVGILSIAIQLYTKWQTEEHMSLVMRKPVFGVFDQVRLKPTCAATEAS